MVPGRLLSAPFPTLASALPVPLLRHMHPWSLLVIDTAVLVERGYSLQNLRIRPFCSIIASYLQALRWPFLVLIAFEVAPSLAVMNERRLGNTEDH